MENQEILNLAGLSAATTSCLLFLAAEEEEILRSKKREWVKVWRRKRAEKGSFNFLQEELRLQDKNAYRQYLRMDEDCFVELLCYLKPTITKKNTLMRDAVCPEEKLAITLRFLATGESYRSTDFQSRLSHSFLSINVPEICYEIYDKLKEKYMRFPTTHNDWREISNGFESRWQFPLCIGALDGKHIAFKASKEDGALYYNYKGFNSIVLLGLCDSEYKFIFVDIGCNGRVSDGGVLNRSNLRDILIYADKYLPAYKKIGRSRNLPYVIIGDDAFPLEKHLLKPYPYHSKEYEKKTYNFRLSHARQTVEHSFGMLSNRFRVLQTDIYLRPEKVKKVVQACCGLHNFLITKSKNYVDPLMDIQHRQYLILMIDQKTRKTIQTKLELFEISSQNTSQMKEHYHGKINISKKI